MRIYILRHGETEWNKVRRLQGVTDIPLDDKGIHLASLAGEAMGREGIRFSACVSSPLVRARKTAELVLEGTGQRYIHADKEMDAGTGVCPAGTGTTGGSRDDAIPFTLDERIREVNLGPLEGTVRFRETEDGTPSMADCFFDRPADYRAPEGAESYQHIIARTGDFLKDMAAKYKDLEGRDYNLLVSTHGCASRAMLMNIAPVDLADYWRGRIPPNCAVSIAELEGGTWKLVLLDHQYAALD